MNNHPDVVKVLESAMVRDERVQVRICFNVCMSGREWCLAFPMSTMLVLQFCYDVQ